MHGAQGKAHHRYVGTCLAGLLTCGTVSFPSMAADQNADTSASSIYAATLNEPGQETPELSTDELRQILAEGRAIVLDARPRREYGVGHIPGALNVAAKPGIPIAQYVSDVAEIGRLVNQDKTADLVLYCNGPFCGKSKRLGVDLLRAGYTHVRRYQLGIPVWRALVGAAQIEQDGLLYVVNSDQTAVLIDARDRKDFETRTLRGARSLPRSALASNAAGEMEAAKNDGRLPMYDHNTRILVFGQDKQQSMAVANAIAHEAFQNVSFYAGGYDDVADTAGLARLEAQENK